GREVEERVRAAVLALERIAVSVVRRRGAVDLVDDVARALRDEVGSTGNGALVAADVDGVDLDARDLLDERPDVARRRDLLELLARKVLARLDLARIEQRRLAGDRHRRLDARKLQLDVDLRVLAD